MLSYKLCQKIKPYTYTYTYTLFRCYTCQTTYEFIIVIFSSKSTCFSISLVNLSFDTKLDITF